MAFLDSDRNVISIRIVYDGPPESGKTTSLRALARGLGRDAFTPHEVAGRTLYFDWMDYTGGLFEGCQICCQIVTVPGQPALAVRRRRLLDAADVVVFVGDTSAPGAAASVVALRELRDQLDQRPAPSIGVVLQANKRDRADALELEELRAQIGAEGWRIGMVESIASEGIGVRETFVLAVRLALDRVRVQLRDGTLPSGRPQVSSGEDLLAALQAEESDHPRRDREAFSTGALHDAIAAYAEAAAPVVVEPAVVEPAIVEPAIVEPAVVEPAVVEPIVEPAVVEPPPLPPPPLLFEPPPAPPMSVPRAVDAPRAPSARVPSGSIWPPVDGRVVLADAAPEAMMPVRLGNGDWVAGLGDGWRVHSQRHAVFADVEQGRAALIQWARLHAACMPLLSPRRCVVLDEDGHGQWRLWQVVRAEPSLRTRIQGSAAVALDAATLLLRLDELAVALIDAIARFAAAPCAISGTADTVGLTDRGPLYVGLMPYASEPPPRAPEPPDQLRDALRSIVVNELPHRHDDLRAAMARAAALGQPALCAPLREVLGEPAGPAAPTTGWS